MAEPHSWVTCDVHSLAFAPSKCPSVAQRLETILMDEVTDIAENGSSF